MIKYDDGVIRIQPPGETMSMIRNGKILRKERVVVDGMAFFKFTVSPGMAGEWSTFYSTDEQKLLAAIDRRCR